MNQNEETPSDSPATIALGITGGVAFVALAAYGFNALENRREVRKGGQKQKLHRLTIDFFKR